MSGRLRRVFPLVAVLCLTPWPVAYTYDSVAGQGTVTVRAADPERLPAATVFGRGIGGIIPGDLFYIDATASSVDIRVTLTVTNALEVSRYLSYLILSVGVYAGDSRTAGGPLVQAVVSLADAQVGFDLPGGHSYRIAVDGGSLRAARPLPSDAAQPQLHLRVD